MCRTKLHASWILAALLIGTVALGIVATPSPAVADGKISFAVGQQDDDGTAPNRVTLVQRRARVRVRAVGPPFLPGPVPPIAPGPVAPIVVHPVAPVVVPAGPPVPPGPTRVRVRVPYFSGDFYVDGPVPYVEAEEPAEPQAGVRAEARAVVRVNYSSNRQYRALVRAYGELRGQLTTLTTGEKWQHYLQLPLQPVPDQAVLDSLYTEDGRGRLTACLQRYGRVSQDAQFEVVTRLPAFDRCHQALRAFASWLEEQPVTADAPAPPPEEVALPTPAPVPEPEPDLAGPEIP